MDSPDDIKQWRRAQRADLLARRIAVTDAQHRLWTAAITELLTEAFPILKSIVVSFYWPFKGEPDPRFAIHHFRKRGARVVLPAVIQKAAPLQFHEWWPGVHVTKGVFDLPVPDGTDVLSPQALLIPPIGFDSKGYRLGYGGGYFDRTLAAMAEAPLKIGIAFELSRIATIHPQPHDIPMDFIVTESGVHRVGKDGIERLDDPRHATGLVSASIVERRSAGSRDEASIAPDIDGSGRARVP